MNLLPENMPGGWAATTLGEVTDYGAPKQVSPQNISPDAWILELEDVEKDTSRIIKRVTFAERGSKSDKAAFAEGDVLYGKLRPYLNKVVVADGPGYCTTEIIPITPREAVVTRFVYYALKTPAFLSHVAGLTRGINMPRLTTESARAVQLPLPPLNEQRRIVAKLDALFERSRNIRDKLDRIPTLLDKLRKSILAAAMSGALTREWRDAHPHLAVWAEGAIEDVAAVGTGSTPLRSNPTFYAETGTPWVTSAATGEPYVTGSREYVTDKAIAAHRLKLYPVGTLLVAMYGEGKTRGQVTELSIEATINQACAAVVVDESKADRRYIKLALQAKYLEMRALAEGGNQPNLNLSKVKQLPVRLPSLAEQEEIVRRTEAMLRQVSGLGTIADGQRERQEKLDSILLNKAFRGELVPQDPNDEPASVLLERIRAERECDGSSRRRRTGR